MRRDWTTLEIARLKQLREQDGLGYAEIAKLLNRSPLAIKKRCDKLRRVGSLKRCTPEQTHRILQRATILREQRA